MDVRHLPFTIREHRRHFPDGFFARLGPVFLTAYTRTYLTSPHALAFIAEIDDRPVGFLVGVTDPGLHRRHVLRFHGCALAGHALTAMAMRPGLALEFLRTRLPHYYRELTPHRRPRQSSASPDTSGPQAVLAHVAVSEEARSFGIGTELIDRFTATAAIAGCVRVSLVTAAGPEGAGPYYERHGWRLRGEIRAFDDRRLLTYECPVGPPPQALGHAGSGS